MKKLRYALFKLGYFITLPGLYLLLHNSHRTRILVKDGDRILLQKTSYGLQWWSLPGGGVKAEESATRGSLRELEEETGIRASPHDIQQLNKEPMICREGAHQLRLNFFLLDLTHKKTDVHISRSLEILELAWFSLQQLPPKRCSTVDKAIELANYR